MQKIYAYQLNHWNAISVIFALGILLGSLASLTGVVLCTGVFVVYTLHHFAERVTTKVHMALHEGEILFTLAYLGAMLTGWGIASLLRVVFF